MSKESTHDWVISNQLDPSLVDLDEQFTLPRPLAEFARKMGRFLVTCSEYAGRAYSPAHWTHYVPNQATPNKPNDEA
jgi:hypothetical protein